MSNITTYPGISVVAGGDLMIISDTSTEGNPTRSVSVSQLGAYIGATGGGAGVSSVNGLSGALTLTPGTNVTFTGVGNNIIINAAGGGGGTTVVANPGSPTGNLSSIEIDSTSYAIPTYDANEVAFWISRDTNSNNITIRSLKDVNSTDATTFSIAEEGTLTGAFIITASTSWFDTGSYWVTMDVNCPVSYLVDTKQVVKKAHVNRLNSTQLQVEFFQETSSSTEILERVDLVVADTTAPNAAQGIDIRVKRWQFPV